MDMKDSHIYERMSNHTAFKVYMNMIKTYDKDIAHDLFANITKEANDHPKYPTIKEAFTERFGNV